MFRFAFIALSGMLAFAGSQDPVPSTPIGIFESQNDVGNVLHPGSAEYDANVKTYVVSGSGDDIWSTSDEFHFVWKQVSARDLSLTADVSILGTAAQGHRKGVLMIRQSLDGDSAYVDAALHGDGLTSLQFRDRKGAITREIESNVSGPARLRIEKQGDRFYLWVGGKNEPLQFAGGSAHVEMQAPFYVGIGASAHEKDATLKVAFTNVDLSTTVSHDRVRYSTVETVLLSGDARSGFVSPQRLTAPGWNADGHSLTFEIAGHRQESPFTPLKTAAPVGAPVTAQPGAQLEQIASDDFNNASPHLSPDGKYVVFLSYSKDLPTLSENQEVTLRIMSLADKSIKPLATFVGGPGSLGTQPWSPDGRRVAFISYQTME